MKKKSISNFFGVKNIFFLLFILVISSFFINCSLKKASENSYSPTSKADLQRTITAEIGKQGNNANLNSIDTSAITDMSYLFRDKKDFNGDVSGWNVSRVNNMAGMFYRASKFNGDLSKWKIENVKNMQEMFYEATLFSQNLEIWNIGADVNKTDMFNNSGVKILPIWTTKPPTTKPPRKYKHHPKDKDALIKAVEAEIKLQGDTANLNNIDTSAIKDMKRLFVIKKNFNGDVSEWNVSKVTNMQRMFSGATKFNGDLSKWNVSQVTGKRSGIRDETTGGMEGMFYYAEAFEGKGLSKWKVENVITMNNMFAFTPAFNGDISKWDVSKVIDMELMFDGATNFNRDISGWDVSKVENMTFMFKFATKFNQNIGWNKSTKSGWDVSKVKSMRGMFYNAIEFDQNISGWNVSEVTNMSTMFYDAVVFNQDISGWDVSKVTDMRAMFEYSIYGFEADPQFNQDISKWKINSIKKMERMFYNAKLFKKNLDDWKPIIDRQKPTMTDMFGGISGLKDSPPSWYKP